MRSAPCRGVLILAASILGSGCVDQDQSNAVNTNASPAAGKPSAVPSGPTVVRIDVGADSQKRAQTAMIKAKAGDVIEFGPGKFEFKSTLSLDASHVTIRGHGLDKTILSFVNQGQGTGGEGLLITSKEHVTVEDLAVEDPKGDAIKASGTKRLTLRRVRTEWTGGPKETNGGYGIYPVLCTDLLIENCTAIGASDAGIYVGQSENIIVRRNRAVRNVAGIEIENSVGADVYENEATDNSGGILVFTMPELPKKEGRRCRVFNNKIVANNHENFAPKGNIVAGVPPGTGLMIMASDQVEAFKNTIEGNQTSGLSIVSYLLTEKPIKDDKFDPFSEGIHVHDNQFAKNGENPAGELGTMLGKLLGTPLPDILYDGMVDERKRVGGHLPENLGIRIRNNGDAGFANFDAPALAASRSPGGGDKKPNIGRDLKPYDGVLASLKPISIEGVE